MEEGLEKGWDDERWVKAEVWGILEFNYVDFVQL